MFLTNFLEMKGIVSELDEMKIPLSPDANLVKQRTYRSNLHYKENIKDELDRMLEARIIEHVEE